METKSLVFTALCYQLFYLTSLHWSKANCLYNSKHMKVAVKKYHHHHHHPPPSLKFACLPVVCQEMTDLNSEMIRLTLQLDKVA